MDIFQRHIYKLDARAILIIALPLLLWMALRIINIYPNADSLIIGAIGTFCGVYLAFTLQEKTKVKLRKRQWRDSLIAAFQGCEINRTPLKNILLNSKSAINSSFEKFGEFLYSKSENLSKVDEEEKFQNFLAIISIKTEAWHELLTSAERTGFRNLFNPEILQAIGNDELYNQILISYKEMEIFSSMIIICVSECKLMKLPISPPIKRFEELRHHIEGIYDESIRSDKINDETLDLIKSELERLKVNISSIKRSKEVNI